MNDGIPPAAEALRPIVERIRWLGVATARKGAACTWRSPSCWLGALDGPSRQLVSCTAIALATSCALVPCQMQVYSLQACRILIYHQAVDLVLIMAQVASLLDAEK